MSARKQVNKAKIELYGRRWRATLNWRGVRLRPTFLTREEAEAWANDQSIRMIRGQEIEPPHGPGIRSSDSVPRTVQRLYEHVRDTHWLRGGPSGGPKKSWPKIKLQIEQAVEAIGPNMALSKLTVAYVEGKLRDLEQGRGNAPGTTNRRKSYLNLMLKEGLRLGAIDRPLNTKKAPESNEGRIFRITLALERDMLLWAISKGNEAFYDFLVLSIYLGQRENETLRLRLSESLAHPLDGYLDGSEFALLPRGNTENKSRLTRSVPVRPIVAEVVNRHRAKASSPDERILEGVTKNQVSHWFAAMKEQFLLERHPEIVKQKRDGMPVGKDYCIHIMRSEFCTRLGDEGFTIPEIADYSGHTNLKTCARYVKPHKLAHRMRLLRERSIDPSALPGGEIPDFAPTQPIATVKRGTLSVVPKAPEPAPGTITPEMAVKLIEAMQAAGLGEMLKNLVAGVETKQA